MFLLYIVKVADECLNIGMIELCFWQNRSVLHFVDAKYLTNAANSPFHNCLLLLSDINDIAFFAVGN